jgi:DNA repair exonuclease SbcCD nuclease subunit
MRFLLYSDLQLHPYKEFASTKGGVNDRLLDHINVLDQIYNYAIKQGIEYIFFGGDMFETRTRVDVVAAKLLADWKWKVSQAGIMQVDIIGNHDLCDKSTLNNALDLYAHFPKQYIVKEPQWVGPIYCVPYMHRLDDVLEALNNVHSPDGDKNAVAIIHYGLYDVPTESYSVIRDLGYDTEGQVRIGDLSHLLGQVKHAFFGHFHVTHSVTPNIHFIGTPLQHKWGERLVGTRFLDIDTEKGTFKPVETSAPRFYQFESIAAFNISNQDVTGQFVRVKVETLEEREAIIKKLYDCGARGC